MDSREIIIMGFGKMPADCARFLIERELTIRFILETEPAAFSPLAGLCKRNNLSYRLSSREETGRLLSGLTQPAVVFSINNNYIFPEEIVAKSNLRIINFHNSLLPAYPGHGKVIPTWAIFNGESQHGVTWHLINTGIDAGNILLQESFAIQPEDTALGLMMRAINSGTTLFKQNIDSLLDPQFTGHAQPGRGSRIYRGKDIPNRGFIDSSWDYATLSRFLRSMDYSPFNLLPPARITVAERTCLVKKYQLDPDECADIPDIISHREESGHLTSIQFQYPRGKITIFLLEDN